jgi:hypothetical protein
MLNERPRLVGENEAVFRSVNEMVRPVEAIWMRILCECGDGTCREHIVVAQNAYSRVREHATRFLIRPGHESVETEKVGSRGSFSMVQYSRSLETKQESHERPLQTWSSPSVFSL